MIKSKLCEVCKLKENRYRCPKCRIVYCTLDCFKQHKECCTEDHTREGQDEAKNPQTMLTSDGSVLNPTFQITEASEDKVSPEQLQSLGHSAQMKDMLCNPHLRQIMTSLVHSKDPAILLESSMQEPLFTELVDKCLAIIDNQDDIGISDSD